MLWWLVPGLSLRSNPGLKLANAFGVLGCDEQTPSALHQVHGCGILGVFGVVVEAAA